MLMQVASQALAAAQTFIDGQRSRCDGRQIVGPDPLPAVGPSWYMVRVQRSSSESANRSYDDFFFGVDQEGNTCKARTPREVRQAGGNMADKRAPSKQGLATLARQVSLQAVPCLLVCGSVQSAPD